MLLMWCYPSIPETWMTACFSAKVSTVALWPEVCAHHKLRISAPQHSCLCLHAARGAAHRLPQGSSYRAACVTPENKFMQEDSNIVEGSPQPD